MFRRKKKLFSFGNSTYDADKICAITTTKIEDKFHVQIIFDIGLSRFDYDNEKSAKENYQVAVGLWKMALDIRN